MPDRRCQLCGSTKRDDSLVLDPYFWLKSATTSELEHFSEACLWCNVLKEIYLKCLTDEERKKGGVLDWGKMFEPVWSVGGKTVEFEVFRISDDMKFIDNLPIKGAVPAINSTASFTQVVRWIKYCDSLHSHCTKDSTTSLPKRLLDIGLNASRFTQRVKLVETQGEEEPYICLSHCWGSQGQRCITTKKNYLENMTGVAWEALPKTFQDTIEFCRKLKIRYLWVDSLCIIQDDELDWAAESARMGTIYQGAYITIAATASKNGSGGIFQDDTARPYKTHSFQITKKAISGEKIFFRRKLPHFSLLSEGGQHGHTALFPLLQRAWVYEERLLSPRVLHFTADELVWECLEAFSCQCQQGSEPFQVTESRTLSPDVGTTPLNFKAYHRFVYETRDWSNYPDRHSMFTFYNQWQSVIRHYSSGALTVPADKLPALSGLAQLLHSKAPSAGDYLGGMWSGDLEIQLLWVLHPDEPRVERLSQYRAPSWSWASVEGTIHYPWGINRYMPNPIFIEVLGAKSVPLHHDVYGQLATASLSILGPLVDATITYNAKARSAADYSLHVPDGLVNKFRIDYAVQQVDEEHHVASGDCVKCLRVRHRAGDNRVLSVVLRQVEPNINVYRRIGVAEEVTPREEVTQARSAERYKEMLAGEWPKQQGKMQIITII